MINQTRSPQTSRTIFLVGGLFFAAVIITAFFGAGIRNAYIQSCSSISYPPGDNPIWGYTWAHDNKPFHKENMLFGSYVGMFAGGLQAIHIPAQRSIYALPISLFAGPLSLVDSFIIVNALCWLIAVVVSFRFCLYITKSTFSAALHAIFVIIGTGYAFHVHDYAAHQMAFTLYYLGAYILLVSEVWKRPRELKQHVCIGFYLALACLEYNSGLFLVAVYVAISLGRQRLIHIAIGCIIPMVLQAGWPIFVNFLFGVNVDHYSIEKEKLDGALNIWLARAGSFTGFIQALLRHLVELLIYDPTVLAFVAVAGAIAVLRQVALFRRFDWRLAWFISLITLIPCLLMSVWAPYVTARGYVSYGSSIGLYFIAAVLLTYIVDFFKARRLGVIGYVALASVFLPTAYWTYSALWGNTIPSKIYFFGGAMYDFSTVEKIITEGFSYRADIQNLSDPNCDNLPGLTKNYPRGDACAISTKVFDQHAATYTPMQLPWDAWAMVRGLLVRTYLLIPIFGILICSMGVFSKSSLFMYWVITGWIWIVPIFMNRLVPPEDLEMWNWEANPITCKTNQVQYSINVQSEVLRELARFNKEGYHLDILQGFGWGDVNRVTIRVGEVILAEKTRIGRIGNEKISIPTALKALSETPVITVDVEGDIASFMGWQSVNLKGRRVTATGCGDITSTLNALPLFELRVLEQGTAIVRKFWI